MAGSVLQHCQRGRRAAPRQPRSRRSGRGASPPSVSTPPPGGGGWGGASVQSPSPARRPNDGECCGGSESPGGRLPSQFAVCAGHSIWPVHSHFFTLQREPFFEAAMTAITKRPVSNGHCNRAGPAWPIQTWVSKYWQ